MKINQIYLAVSGGFLNYLMLFSFVAASLSFTGISGLAHAGAMTQISPFSDPTAVVFQTAEDGETDEEEEEEEPDCD